MVEERAVAPHADCGTHCDGGLYVGGTLLTLWGNATLFDAVAVAGTASMFLTPVLIVGLVMGRRLRCGHIWWLWRGNLGAFAYFARGWALCASGPRGTNTSSLLVICVLFWSQALARCLRARAGADSCYPTEMIG